MPRMRTDFSVASSVLLNMLRQLQFQVHMTGLVCRDVTNLYQTKTVFTTFRMQARMEKRKWKQKRKTEQRNSEQTQCVEEGTSENET